MASVYMCFKLMSSAQSMKVCFLSVALQRLFLRFALKCTLTNGKGKGKGKGKITVAVPFRNRRVPYYYGVGQLSLK
jgi:hypothetical protein